MLYPMDVQFHSNYNQEAHLAVNVKVYKRFNKIDTLNNNIDNFDDIVEICWQQVMSDFWEFDAQEIAQNCGFREAYSEGRSDGWCVPFPFITREIWEEAIETGDVIVDRFLSFQENIEKLIAGAEDELCELVLLNLPANERNVIL